MKKTLLAAFIISAAAYAENTAEVTLDKTYVKSTNGCLLYTSDAADE